MPGVFVVTDSSCDLEHDDIAPFNVEIVPLTIRFGSEKFTDRLDLSTEDFYRRMSNSPDLPQTACPSPGAFEEAFRNAIDAGAEAVVCLNISSDLSTTVQSARTAAAASRGADSRPCDRQPECVEQARYSCGEAAKTAAGGADAGAVLRRVSELIPRTHVLAALNTLENLKKGGRIGGATAMVGSLLSIKPVIDLTGGVVHEAGKARTRKRALQMLYERLSAAGPIEDVAVMHGGATDIDQFLDLIAPRLPREAIRIGTLGAVVGVHGGPQMIGVSWIAAA